MTATSTKTLRLLIHGRVQGVYFRDSMRTEALRLGIAGWVCNREDGTVEATVQGESAAVDTLVRWAHRGPPHARVEKVDIAPDVGIYDRFDITG